MKEFLKYRIKKCILPFVVLCACALAIYVLPLLTMSGVYVDENSIIDQDASYMYNLRVGSLAVFLVLSSLIIAVWSSKYKMKKRSLDLYYSLPITKRKLLFVQYATGFITILCAYTVAFVLGLAVSLIKFNGLVRFEHYAWLYFAFIIPTYVVYSIAAFFFTRANTTGDGIMFILMALLFPPTILNFASYYVGDLILRPSLFYAFQGLSFINEIFNSLANGFAPTHSGAIFINNIVSLILYIVLSAVFTFLLFYSEKYAKAENAEQISNSWFGYKIMIPAYSTIYYFELSNAGLLIGLLSFPIIALIAYIVEAIHMRTLKIGMKKAWVHIVCLVLGIVFFIIINVYNSTKVLI